MREASPDGKCPLMRIVVVDRRLAWPLRFWRAVRALIHRPKLKLRTRPAAFRVKTPGGWRYFENEETAQRIAGEGRYQGLYVRDGGRR